MPQDIVNINNVHEIEYLALMELLKDTYRKELPIIDINHPADTLELEHLMIYFASQYAYITELWARMAHEVRLLKRTSKSKDAIDLATDKRDYLDKVMSATKIKYYSARVMLKIHTERIE